MVVKDEIKALLAPITEAVFLADTPKSALIQLEVLKQTDKNGVPFILLLLPVTENEDRSYTDVTVSFVLGTVTTQDLSTDERQLKTFTPILEPIYNKFKALIKSGNSKIKGNHMVKFNKINQYYWGQDATVLQNYIDCIEIRDLELKIKNTNC